MSLATAASTQPMAIPWLTARRGQPARILLSLDCRVSLIVEDDACPVADLHARVLAAELVALLSVVTSTGRVLEQKRVRARSGDAPRFAATVIEQVEWACQTCPGIDVAVAGDGSACWVPVRAGLAALVVDGEPVQVHDVVRHDARVEMELIRRPRRG